MPSVSHLPAQASAARPHAALYTDLQRSTSQDPATPPPRTPSSLPHPRSPRSTFAAHHQRKRAAGRQRDGAVWGAMAVLTLVGLAAADTYTSVSVGGAHTCALTSTGGVVCWGWTGYGQCGASGGTGDVLSPIVVQGMSGAVSLATGWAHTCVVLSGGGAYCWGANAAGQLGNHQTSNLITPPSQPVLAKTSAIVAGYAHTCALMTSGGVMCWGDNTRGQLGSATMGTFLNYPLTVAGVAGATLIAAGWTHTCALITTSDLICWGGDAYGQVNIVGTLASMGPTTVMSGVASVSAGWAHTCALTQFGGVTCWGNNGTGQVGGANTWVSVPLPVNVTTGAAVGYPVLNSATVVTAGWGHTCALVSGSLLCWGDNTYNESVGYGPVKIVPVPAVALWPEVTITAVSASTNLTCGVTLMGCVVCQGFNSHGQTGTNASVGGAGPTLLCTPPDQTVQTGTPTSTAIAVVVCVFAGVLIIGAALRRIQQHKDIFADIHLNLPHLKHGDEPTNNTEMQLAVTQDGGAAPGTQTGQPDGMHVLLTAYDSRVQVETLTPEQPQAQPATV